MTKNLLYKMFTVVAAAGLVAAAGCDKTPILKGSAGGAGGGHAGSSATAGTNGGLGGTAGTEAGGAGGGGGIGGATMLTPVQARGKYIVDVVAACGDCHTPRDANGPIAAMYLAGNASFIVAGPDQSLGSRNLTNDPTGLKNRTDMEIKNMFQNGLRPTATAGVNEALNPIMPYYVFHNMTDADADAVVAYLRTVPAVSNMIPRRGTMFDVGAPAPALPDSMIPLPDPAYPELAMATQGRYLATKAGVCIECHTKHLDPKTMPATVLDETKLFAGGEDFSALFATTLMIHPVSKNLTSDMTTGLGKWTVADIVKALKMGVAKDGSGICPPMPVGPMGAFGHLTDEDATAIAHYIKSLPTIPNMIVDMCQFPPGSGAGGAGGSNGAGGAGGTAGQSGTAGTSGSAGSSGTAGSTGTAGAGGQLGVGGAGGA